MRSDNADVALADAADVSRHPQVLRHYHAPVVFTSGASSNRYVSGWACNDPGSAHDTCRGKIFLITGDAGIVL